LRHVERTADACPVSKFTPACREIHKDAPCAPHVAHSLMHRAGLTAQVATLNFASQGVPGAGARVTSGEGGRTTRRPGTCPSCEIRPLAPARHRRSPPAAENVGRPCHCARVRPALRAGLLPVWRDDDTVQIGVDPRRAVAIAGMSHATDVISLLDGSRDRAEVVAEAGRCGVPAMVAERILTVLAAAGVLIDFPAQLLRSVPADLRRRLRPVLAAASLASQDGDGGARLLARRSATAVAVSGAGPVGDSLADLLTRSGLAARRGQPADGGEVDLLVLVGHQSPSQTAELLRFTRPHLAVTASEGIGVVGPLVWPGSTACLRCLDLARAERDPAWPLVLAQLSYRSVDPEACDPVLIAAVAAQAAAIVVAFADGGAPTRAAVNATLELVTPGWQWRRRSWRPHPACCCGASVAG
jgi:bacteriocin biosynthesis cyclodehydratase domain-containing protein